MLITEMNVDERSAYRILQARSTMVKSHRFYGVLVANVEPVSSRKFPTMATNGKQHFFNPDFIDTLSQDELDFVQMHESEHDARHHHTRRGTRDPEKWNVACDYSINIDLVDLKIGKPPKGALIDPKYRGMSAEDIYRCRELDEQQKKKDEDKPQPKDEPDDEESKGDDEGDDSQEPDEQEGDEPDSDDGDDGESDSDEQSDDEESDDGEGADGEGDDDSDDGDEAKGAGDGEGDDEADTDGGSADGEGEGEADAESESSKSSGDPGGCGEVLDAADDSTANAEEDHKWERITRQAVSLAKAIGQLPGHISREIERANNPGQDWREQLRAWFMSGCLRIETWNRPNRRFAGSGLFLPGSQRDGISKAVMLIDTSGSMDEIALACVKVETQAALDDGAIDEVVIIYGDTRVTRVDTYRTGEEIEFDPRGGGGTNLRPLFDYVAEEVSDASLIVCFTDMEFGDLGPEPHCPVLFAATGYPDKVRHYLANAPWGSPGIDVGSH